MTLRTFIKASVASLAIAVAAPVQAQSAFDFSQYMTQPKGHQGPSLCSGRSSDPAFSAFNCELVQEAMWTGDMSVLRHGSVAELFNYLKAFANTVQEPSVTFKIDASVYSRFDPTLLRRLDHKVLENPGIFAESAGASFDHFLKGAENFLNQRDQAVRNNQLRPVEELFGLLNGLSMHKHPLVLAGDIGRQDGLVWIAIAQQDPDSAIEIYNGLVTLVDSF